MGESLPNPTQLWQETLHWQPEEQEQRAFQALYEAILEANQQVNLTRITTPADFWEKHLWDSLQGIGPWLNQTPSEDPFRVIDIGTGGGFPGLPVALAQPRWQVTLLDSTRKKIAAIAAVSQSLGLSQGQLLADRAEQVGHQPSHREAYDLALVRAVGSPPTCVEYALPLLKLGGQAVLYRGQWTDAEAADLKVILPRLGGQLLRVRAMETPITRGARHYVDVLKVEPTPDQFPRATGIPAKTPLRAS